MRRPSHDRPGRATRFQTPVAVSASRLPNGYSARRAVVVLDVAAQVAAEGADGGDAEPGEGERGQIEEDPGRFSNCCASSSGPARRNLSKGRRRK
jgi:hypothetical protein